MNAEARSMNLIALRDIVWVKSSTLELAGDAATLLSKLSVKDIRDHIKNNKLINPEEGSREEYLRKALSKVAELAEEFQKDFSQTSHDKFGKTGVRPELN